MTKEERVQRRKKNAEKNAEWTQKRALKYPWAELSSYADDDDDEVMAEICLEQGEDDWLKVRQRGEWPPEPTTRYMPDCGWKEMKIPLNKLTDLARFIHALICRYNALVEEANATAANCHLTPLAPIQNGDNPS